MRRLKYRGRRTFKDDKSPVITLVERKTGKTIFSVEKNLSKQLIQEKLGKHCIKVSKIFTDDYTIYSNSKVAKWLLNVK